MSHYALGDCMMWPLYHNIILLCSVNMIYCIVFNLCICTLVYQMKIRLRRELLGEPLLIERCWALMKMQRSVPSVLTPSAANPWQHQKTVSTTSVSTASWSGPRWVWIQVVRVQGGSDTPWYLFDFQLKCLKLIFRIGTRAHPGIFWWIGICHIGPIYTCRQHSDK